MYCSSKRKCGLVYTPELQTQPDMREVRWLSCTLCCESHNRLDDRTHCLCMWKVQTIEIHRWQDLPHLIHSLPFLDAPNFSDMTSLKLLILVQCCRCEKKITLTDTVVDIACWFVDGRLKKSTPLLSLQVPSLVPVEGEFLVRTWAMVTARAGCGRRRMLKATSPRNGGSTGLSSKSLASTGTLTKM